MGKLAADGRLRARMADSSSGLILDYSPSAWAEGVSKAVQWVTGS